MNILNMPTAEQFDMQNALLASIASNIGTSGIEITSWKDIQRVVRMGLADKIFKVGDQFVSSYDTGQVVWNVIGINHDIPTDKKYTNSLTIQANDCIMNCQFDAPEALYYAATELVPGNYYFYDSYSKKNYQFTLASAVTVGGVIFISAWSTNTPTQVKTYANKTTTAAIETATVTEGNTGTQLITINDIRRCQYGSDNYFNSAIRQWLNSNATTFAWSPKTNFDMPSTGGPYSGGGFLKLLDPELSAVLGAVDKQVAKNTVTDGGGQDVFSDKVFLLSRVEAYADTEGVVTGEQPYTYYSAMAGAATSGVLAGRIKLLSGSPRYWWLRSPFVGYSYYPRLVSTTGELYIYIANIAYGLSPACCII